MIDNNLGKRKKERPSKMALSGSGLRPSLECTQQHNTLNSRKKSSSFGNLGA